jgi:hypothetical protein
MTVPADLAVRYLLGDLPEAEREALEERYFLEADAFEELKAVEDDLIDAYCRGTLAAPQRPLFEARYLQSESGRHRVEFARALTRASVASRQRRRGVPAAAPRRWLAWAAAIATVALGAAGLWQLGHLRAEVREVRQEKEALQRSADASAAELGEMRQRLGELTDRLTRLRVHAGVVATLVLSAGLERGSGDVPRLVLKPDTEEIGLTLRLPVDGHDRYDASLQTVDGREVWRGNGLAPVTTAHGRALDIGIPAATLRTQSYVVLVRGRDEPASALGHSYVFEVRRP